MFKKKSISITIAATSLILAGKTDASGIGFIDCIVQRETEKAIMVDWLPKKALTASKILGQDVYTVAEWFEKLDHGQIDDYFNDYGYKCHLSEEMQKTA